MRVLIETPQILYSNEKRLMKKTRFQILCLYEAYNHYKATQKHIVVVCLFQVV